MRRCHTERHAVDASRQRAALIDIADAAAYAILMSPLMPCHYRRDFIHTPP